MPAPPPPDRELLYAALARRMGLVSDAALMEALGAWVGDPSRPLGPALLGRHALTPHDHARIEVELDCIAAAPRHTEAGSIAEDPAATDGGGTTLADTAADADPAATVDLPATLPHPHGAAAPPRPAADGRFRVVRLHARGGLGQVSRAWDAQLGRQVALKELRPDLDDSPERRARFILEAEINGNLEHPAIVPVYALGTFPDGRPYYAMRFVEGRTLQQALDAFHERAATLTPAAWTLGLRQLLGHFLDVCGAIAYAHSRGVLHRDIKPTNVMIGPFGETHIIDWGLAKATGRPEPAADGAAGPAVALHASLGGATPTQAGCVFGSPPYMSPEQAAGRLEDLDRASDVYGLGATLYALLTGRPPVVERDTRAALDRVIRGAIDPPRAVNPRVPPALEAICRKAMHLDPAGRYPSAHALADDIRRWMADEPVAVHRDSAVARALRWARHHRPLVVGAAALTGTALVALAIATVVVGGQRDAARRARDRTAVALREAREARRLAEYHALNGVRLIDELVRLGDRQLVGAGVPASRRRQLLGGALHFIRATRMGRPDDVQVQVEAAQIARRLAHLYAVIGDFDEAAPLLAEAIGLLDQLLAADPGSPRLRNLLAEALTDEAELRKNRGDPAGALPPALRAVEVARRNAADHPGDPAYRLTLARALSRSGEILRKLGRAPDPDPSQEAAALLEAPAHAGLGGLVEAVRRGSFPALMDQLEWVTALVFLAEARAARGEAAGAAEPLRRATGRMDELARLFEGSAAPDVDYFHAWAGAAFARILGDDPGRRGEALQRLDDAFARLTRLAEADGDYLHIRATLAEALAARARLRAAAGRSEDAAADADAVRVRLRGLIAAHPRAPDFLSLLGDVEETLGALAQRAGRPDEARAHLREALRLQDEALGLSPHDPAYTRRRRTAAEALDALGLPQTPERRRAPALAKRGPGPRVTPTVDRLRPRSWTAPWRTGRPSCPPPARGRRRSSSGRSSW